MLGPDISRWLGRATDVAIYEGDPEGQAVRDAAQALDLLPQLYETIEDLPPQMQDFLRRYPES